MEAKVDDAYKLKKITKKKIETCRFALAYHHGNFKKALELLGGEPSLEGGRRE